MKTSKKTTKKADETAFKTPDEQTSGVADQPGHAVEAAPRRLVSIGKNGKAKEVIKQTYP